MCSQNALAAVSLHFWVSGSRISCLPILADMAVRGCPLGSRAHQSLLVGSPHTNHPLKPGQVGRVHSLASVAVSSTCIPLLVSLGEDGFPPLTTDARWCLLQATRSPG